MATKSSKSRKTRSTKTQTSNNSTVVAAILGVLLLVAILVIASGPIQSPVVTQPLWDVPTQTAATEAPATEAPATPIPSVKWTSAMMLPQTVIGKCAEPTVEYEDYQAQVLYNCSEVRAFVVAQQAPTALPTSCELDKIGTWSEISSTSPYRIEVGGHGIQAMDFYPTKDVKSISYIVPAIAPSETPAIWFGYGSNWEGQLSECGNFDFVADATNYAQARLDSGHSGLVIDLRGGQFKVVANVANMSQEDVNALLALHMAAMDPTAK